ncbi:MAG: hypothetical protein K6G82_07415 [Ruminococcus sp.]|nr:hypothetical protein [Ruminococcus sp.]
MKKLLKMLIAAAVLFAAAVVGFNAAFVGIYDKQMTDRNVIVNRINHSICERFTESGTSPEDIIADSSDEWNRTYGKDSPASIRYIPLKDDSDDVFYSAADKKCAVCCVRGRDGEAVGFVEYRFSDDSFDMLRLCVNTFLTAGFVLAVTFLAGTYIKIVMPFRRLSEYPEKLARLRNIQKLPESKSRFFGKYVWGMNMLTDVLSASSKRIECLEGKHQRLVTSIAHGVKTPVANIRLYSDALRTGLLRPGKKRRNRRQDRRECRDDTGSRRGTHACFKRFVQRLRYQTLTLLPLGARRIGKQRILGQNETYAYTVRGQMRGFTAARQR